MSFFTQQLERTLKAAKSRRDAGLQMIGLEATFGARAEKSDVSHESGWR